MIAGTFALRGDMAYRIGRNMTRLEDYEFTPEKIFADETMNGGWPGDWEGRAMLADTLLSRLTGRESAHLERFYRRMELNRLGYRGEELLPRADEQQLSGHNWLVRALLEMYEWKKDERSRKMAESIVENLYLPLRGKYRLYPVDPKDRVVGGSYGGTRDGLERDVWITSTDIGCAFMSMDCLSQYYDLFRDERVLDLLREMLEVFEGIDLVGLKMQTHATLSAVRGVLRLYRATGDGHLRDTAIRVFDTYRKAGMSDAYMNYNWFGRPEWTEPCAMVDSMIIALELYDITGETGYLEFAHRAFYTGLGHAQRQNGGFGCDSCVGALEDGDVLSVRTYEAYWCCSMRGAEGLTRMAEHMVIEKGYGAEFPAYADGLYPLPWGSAEVCTLWPCEGRAEIGLAGKWRGRTVRLYAPAGAEARFGGQPLTGVQERGFLAVTLPADEGRLEVSFDMPIEYRGAVGSFTPRSRVSIWKGPIMLGAAPGTRTPDIARLADTGRGRYEAPDGTVFQPVSRTIFGTEVKPVQVLFEADPVRG